MVSFVRANANEVKGSRLELDVGFTNHSGGVLVTQISALHAL